MPRLFDSKQFRTDLKLSGSFSGSFQGDGSSLNNVPASGIVGLNLSQIASGSVTASISPDKGLQVNTSISGSVISGSTLIISPTGSFQHIITDGETIEFRNPSTKAEIGRLKFDPTTGLNIQDNTGARTKVRAGRGEFLSLEAGPVGFNSIGSITGSIISASSTIFANDIEAFAMNVTNFTASFITASTIETSGSNIFGDESSDTHTFVGDIIAQNNISSSGYISGSVFSGDGSGLINIPASGITGLNLSQIASGSATASIAPDKGFQVNTDTQITGSLIVSGSGITIDSGSLNLNDNDSTQLNIPANPGVYEASYHGLTAGGSGNVVSFSANNVGQMAAIETSGRLGLLRLNNWTANNNGVLLHGYYSTSPLNSIYYRNFIGGSLVVNRPHGSTVATNTIALDVAGPVLITGSNANGHVGLHVSSSAGSGSMKLEGDAQITGSLNINGHTSVTAVTSSNGGRFESAGSAGEFIIKNAGNDADAFTVYMTDGTGTANIGAYGGINFISRYGSIGTVASYNNVGTWGFNYDVNIAPGKHLSGSATSTASFGTYVGDGSGLTGLGGAYGISNSNGVYTYYGTLSASIAAASAGDVVEVFADVVETNPVTILFKNGVNIQGNGHKYTLDHTGSQAAFADYLSTETSGTSISCSINNLQIDRINGDASTANYAATIIINNDTANHDTFLDLRGSEISNNTGDTYICSYKHGRVLGGKFIGNHSGRYFLSAAQAQSTGIHNVTDVYCESQDGYAQVDDAGDSTFVSKNNTAAVVTQGDFVGCTFVSNASSPSQNGAAVTQAGGISGAKLKNCVAWCNGSGTTAIYGVAWIENCSVVNARYYALNYAIDTGGAQSFTLLNSSVYSNAGSAIKIQDGSNTGTLRILNNTIHNDRYSTYGAYPTIYLQGWDNSDNLIANNTIVHGGPYKADNLANAIEVHSGGGSNYTFNIVNNTIKVSQHDAFCISSSAAVAPNIVYAQNTFEGATVPIAPSITQALTNVPDAQGNIHVTSSLDNSRIYSGSFSGSYIGDGSQLSGVSAFPFSGSAVITGSLTVSGSVVDFTSASAVNLNIESIPLVNPQVEYVNCGAITASGATVPLPNGLTFVSSSVYEYIEIFINGLRMRYDVDFAPRSTSTIQYFTTIPSGSEVTYKSLKRP